MTTLKAGARLTLREFLDLPEMEQRCELDDGELYFVPQPTYNHQHLSKMLTYYLTQQLELAGQGLVSMPVDVVLSERVVVAPDIIVVRTERVNIIHPARIHGAPDIVVEVLSSDRQRDLVHKRNWYESAGVSEYWIIDPEADTLTVLALSDAGAYQERTVLTATDTLTTPLFPNFSLPLAQLFDNPARIHGNN